MNRGVGAERIIQQQRQSPRGENKPLPGQRVGTGNVHAAETAILRAFGACQFAINKVARDGVAFPRPLVDARFQIDIGSRGLLRESFRQRPDILAIVRSALLIARIEHNASAGIVKGSAPRRVPKGVQIESRVTGRPVEDVLLVATRILMHDAA